MTTRRIIAIVCNPNSGKGKALAVSKQLDEQLGQKNIQHTLYTSQWPGNFEGFTDVFIVGGDGTLNYFINKYPGIQLPLSIFKGGSGNDFAWKLYGTIPVQEQLEKIIRGTPVAVDAGICNGRYFLNGVGIGFDGEVVKAMGVKRFLSAGHLAYLWAVLLKIVFYRERELTLDAEEYKTRENLFMVSIANGARYGGGFMVAPQANITDGMLDIVTIKCIKRLTRIYYLPKVEKGKHLQLSFVKTALTKKITIQSAGSIAAHIDGELMEGNFFDIEVLPAEFLFLQ